jgi:hypothetical protein
MAASMPVVLASNHSAILVSATLSPATAIQVNDGTDTMLVNADGSINASTAQSGVWNITNISGTISLPTGASTEATLADIKTSAQLLDDAVGTVASAIPTKGIAAIGTDGTNARTIKTDASGELQIDVLTLPALAAGTNSIGTVVVSNVAGSSSVADYAAGSAIAQNATSTHTYTSTGNFYLKQIELSASGKCKFEIAVNAVTKMICFNSQSNPNVPVHISQPILATNTQTVTITKTNLDSNAQDLHSTVIGYYV